MQIAVGTPVRMPPIAPMPGPLDRMLWISRCESMDRRASDHGISRMKSEPIFASGGEVGVVMQDLDWGTTSLGNPATWPISLKSALSMCLECPVPMAIYWGHELTLLHNDAFRTILGVKYPSTLGKPVREVFPELWHLIRDDFARVMAEGQAVQYNDQQLPMKRHGFVEEGYFTYSFSPIRGGLGHIEGTFVVATDMTYRVLGERRTRLLEEMSQTTAAATDEGSACAAALAILGNAAADVPFALVYQLDGQRRQARLHGAIGLGEHRRLRPELIDLADDDEEPWPLRAARDGQSVAVEDIEAWLGQAALGPWPERPSRALVLALRPAGLGSEVGFMILGISARLVFDASYRVFFTIAALHAARAIANARALEIERQRTQQLAEIDKAKTAFFSNVSHEFRTPLTLLLGPLEDAVTGHKPLSHEDLVITHRNALRLLKLVNTLLEFSRIEAGRVQADYRPTAIAALTADLASTFRSATARAGLDLVVESAEPSGQAFVDRDMWEKIVLNLLSNAFKYTLAGGITLRLAEADGAIELQIEDTGIGIADHELPRIFERFHRIENAQGRTHEGSGIGLALVQELVRLHGGTIHATSTFGRGSTFTVRIPLGNAHLPAERIASDPDASPRSQTAAAFVEEALRWLPDPPPPIAATGPPQSAPVTDRFSRSRVPAQAGAARVLIADDNGDMRSYLRTLLGGTFAVTTVADGETAWEAILREAPDLVLTDVMMPRLDGFGLLERVRGAEATRSIPIILLSARAGEEARLEGLRAGADDYLVKPFNARELFARVNAQITLTQLRRESFERERKLEQEKRIANERAAAVLEAMSDGYCALDGDLRILAINPAASLGYAKLTRDQIGKRLWDAVPGLEEHEAGSICRLVAEDRQARAFVTFFDGQWFDVHAMATDQDGIAIFFRDITSRKELEDELAERNEGLERSNADLEHFAGIAAHDLQEPLRMISSYLDLLFMRYAQSFDESALKYKRFILEGTSRMRVMINAILNYSSIGKAPVRLDPISAAIPIVDAIRNLEAKISETSAEISLPTDFPALHADATLLTQLFQNLLSNVLKFSEGIPRIAITISEEPAAWIFIVSDQGIGIPAGSTEKVFGLFQRLATPRTIDGNGIGLASCRRIIELHHGRVWVESTVGKGSDFFVAIPKAIHP
jgi:signal transduction histidine kinase